MERKIKVAFIYKTSDKFFSGTHFDNTTYNFFMNTLSKNSDIEIKYFHEEKIMDVSKLKGKFDIILLAANHNFHAPDTLLGIDKLNLPVISRCGDFHHAKKHNTFQFHEKYKIDYYFNFMSTKYFYKFYPKDFKYKEIIFGLEPSLYENIKPFKNRMKNKILNSGAVGKSSLKSRIVNYLINPKNSGWYFYKLRTMCNELEYVEHTGMIGKKYINDDYPSLLSRYRASITATTYYPTIKYMESTAAGCLTFMEITEKNNGEYLGFQNNENAIFINEQNYKQKFEEFLDDPDNEKWEIIAEKGRRHTLENLSNDKAAKDLVDLMKEFI